MSAKAEQGPQWRRWARLQSSEVCVLFDVVYRSLESQRRCNHKHAPNTGLTQVKTAGVARFFHSRWFELDGLDEYFRPPGRKVPINDRKQAAEQFRDFLCATLHCTGRLERPEPKCTLRWEFWGRPR